MATPSSFIQDPDSQLGIVWRSINHHQNYRREAKLVRHPPLPPILHLSSHLQYSLSSGKTECPSKCVHLCRIICSPPQNLWNTRCIHKAPNMSRIAIIRHVPSKNDSVILPIIGQLCLELYSTAQGYYLWMPHSFSNTANDLQDGV